MMALRDPLYSGERPLYGLATGGAFAPRCQFCLCRVHPGARWCKGCDEAIIRAYDYEGSGLGLVAAHGPHFRDGACEPTDLRGHPGAVYAPRESTCQVCAGLFVARGSNARYCSDCRATLAAKQIKTVTVERSCPLCGQHLPRYKRYCSEPCRERANAASKARFAAANPRYQTDYSRLASRTKQTTGEGRDEGEASS